MNERAQAASSRPFNGCQPLTLIAQAPGWISLVPATALHHPAVLCRSAKGTYPVLRLFVCTFVVIRIAVVLGFVNIMSIFRIQALFFRLQYAIYIIAYCNSNGPASLVMEL